MGGMSGHGFTDNPMKVPVPPEKHLLLPEFARPPSQSEDKPPDLPVIPAKYVAPAPGSVPRPPDWPTPTDIGLMCGTCRHWGASYDSDYRACSRISSDRDDGMAFAIASGTVYTQRYFSCSGWQGMA